MEKVILAEQKLAIFQKIMQVESKTSLNQIQMFIEKFLSEFNSNLQEDKSKLEKFEEEFDASKLTFEEWNKQFEDELNLDEYIPEYGMSLKDFRLMIYNSERSESYPIEKFYKKLEEYV